MKRDTFIFGLLAAGSPWLFSRRGNASSLVNQVVIHANFPGGNIAVVEMSGDRVKVKPDFRDTKGFWHYWAFCVEGAQGKTLTFEFTEGAPLSNAGAAVSHDLGWTWAWHPPHEQGKAFTYTFREDETKVCFAVSLTYTQRNLDSFFKKLSQEREVLGHFEKGVLCKSRDQREVPFYRLGQLGQEPKHRMLLTARSHACETNASYVLEGIVDGIFANDAHGKWLRENVEFMMIPFVDMDGVEKGDQGKNRIPRDHNRDYEPGGIYPETQAIMQQVPAWGKGKIRMSLDLHGPTLRGGKNEMLYFVGNENPLNRPGEQKFSALLENLVRGPLPYRASNNLAYGTGWNVPSSFSAGTKMSTFARSLEGIVLSTTLEVPYGVVEGRSVSAQDLRGFGRDMSRAIEALFKDL